MSKVVLNFCMVVLLALLANSCIKEDQSDCPTQFTVKLIVKDINYFNIAQFPELSPEAAAQPFAHFTSTLYYTVTDKATRQVVQQSDVLTTSGSTQDYTILLNNLPVGEYEFSVWGNITNDIPAGILHPNGLEHTDIYTARASITITPESQSQTVELERTKGKLVVFCRNFPDEITGINLSASPVYQSADTYLNYQGNASVQKSATRTVINETLMAPTPEGDDTTLNLNFDTQATRATSPVLSIPPISVTIHRNEITAVSLDYDIISNALEIWAYINGEWSMLHHLDIK